MRIYMDCMEAVREVEREMWEMSIRVPIESMQDKVVAGDPELGMTRELRAYGFTILPPQANRDKMVQYLFPGNAVLEYCRAEHKDRISGQVLNPGNSYMVRNQVWSEFLHDGQFAYTYSERITPQLNRVIEELRVRPGTRQAIIEIHNNEIDLDRMGGKARIPCSMYYQLLRREGKLDLIYTMRSCDFLTHAPVDWWLAMAMQEHIAWALAIPVGNFTYFTGSLHAYARELKLRGIF